MKHIGKYQVLGLLGRGGMGAVYKVAAPVTGRILALKLLAPAELVAAQVGPEECERRFLREARTMGALRHPNLAGAADFDHDQAGRPFYTMEYFCTSVGSLIGETYRVEGPTRVLPLDRAADIALQALAGLSRLHAAGVVHCDVKPFNLLLADRGAVKLIDFGLSRLRGEGPAPARGEKVGSPYYAAPEQEEDPALADARSDLYALAVTLYRMLLGRLPEPGAPAPSRRHPDLDPAWDAFFAQGLDPDPQGRFAEAKDMAAALRNLLAAWQERLASACALPPEPASPPSQGPAPAAACARRSHALRTGPGPARAFFPVDELARPLAYLDPDRFADQGLTVRDPLCGLTWQQGGSDFALAWTEAADWLAALNSARFAGRDDWRLPTAEELLTLLAPPRRGADFCLAPRFDPAQTRLWSTDRATYTSAWFAQTVLGCLDRMDLTCLAHVRAVAGDAA